MWPSKAPISLEESVNDQRDYAIPVVLVMTKAIVEDVARDHEGLNLFLLTYFCKLDRCVLLVGALYVLHHQILYLQFDGLRWLNLVVMLKVDIKHILYVNGSATINQLNRILVLAEAFLRLLVRICLFGRQTLK